MQDVAALAHCDGQADRRLAVVAKEWLERVYVASVNLGDVGKPEELIADAEIDRFEALFGNELPADADRNLLGAGLDHAGRNDRILRLERFKERIKVQLQPGELADRNIQVNRSPPACPSSRVFPMSLTSRTLLRTFSTQSRN